MSKYVILCFVTCSFLACKNDQSGETSSKDIPVVSLDNLEQEKPTFSKELYAGLDRLRIRVDSSLNSKTAITSSEGDTLEYLGQTSHNRLALKLRSRYHYEPWLKVKHIGSGKVGWVYGGAVNFQSPKLRESINENSSVYQQIHADDLEWDGNVPTSWSSATISDPIGFKIFLLNFKELVRKREVLEISKLINYPIKNLENRGEFEENYNRIFGDGLTEKIRSHRLDRIFRDTKGAYFGDDDIIFKEINGQYKIVYIDFEGVEDLARSYMDHLSGTYLDEADRLNRSVEVMRIREFLELRLNYNQAGAAKSMPLGKYVLESIKGSQAKFKQETKRVDKRELIFDDVSDFIDLKIFNSVEPNLDGVNFRDVREI